MIVTLLVLSILFNLINLYLIIVLWKKTSITMENDVVSEKNAIEDLLVAYSTELKEENEKFLTLIQQQIGNLESMKQQNETGSSTPTEPSSEPVVEDMVSVIHDSEQLNPDQSIQEQAIYLSKQGLNVSEIAKTLNKGKGEIELLLKFYKE